MLTSETTQAESEREKETGTKLQIQTYLCLVVRSNENLHCCIQTAVYSTCAFVCMLDRKDVLCVCAVEYTILLILSSFFHILYAPLLLYLLFFKMTLLQHLETFCIIVKPNYLIFAKWAVLYDYLNIETKYYTYSRYCLSAVSPGFTLVTNEDYH